MLRVFTEKDKPINFLSYNLLYLIFKPFHSNFNFILLKPFFFLFLNVFCKQGYSSFKWMMQFLLGFVCASLSDGIICWPLHVLLFLFFQRLSLCNSYYFASLLLNISSLSEFFGGLCFEACGVLVRLPGHVPPVMNVIRIHCYSHALNSLNALNYFAVGYLMFLCLLVNHFLWTESMVDLGNPF